MVITIVVTTLILLAICSFYVSYKIKHYEWLHLISGYNRLNEEAKKQVNLDKLTRHLSLVSYVTGFYLLGVAVFTFAPTNSISLVIFFSITFIYMSFIVFSAIRKY